MTPQPSKDYANALQRQRLFKSLGCIGSLGLLSSGLMSGMALSEEARDAAQTNSKDVASVVVPQLLAQLESDPSIESAPEPPAFSSEAVDLAPPPAPVEAAPAEPVPVEAPIPAPEIEPPVVNLAPEDLAPPSSESYEEQIISPINDAAAIQGSNTMIDSTDLYSTGATQRGTVQQVQPQVVVTDRSNGCQQTLQANGLAGNCGSTAIAPTAKGNNAAQSSGNPGANLANSSPTGARGNIAADAPNVQFTGAHPAPNAPATTQVAGDASYQGGYSVTFPGKMQNPLQMAVQSLGQTLSQSVDVASYYARTVRPLGLRGNGDRQLLFPLSVPAPISSVFGWRLHPIANSWRFHSGTDLAADQGTPVVAALSGQVSTADFVGGYGLTVVIDHVGGQSETLYGHLSEIFVRPGQVVRQGEVIGRVGSTGNSTGPHLHFEVRQFDPNSGWVAVDPGRYLEGAVAQLMNVLRNEPVQTAQLSPIPLAQSIPIQLKQGQPNLSTGLMPLLQQTAVQKPVQPTTPLERAVVQVVKSLETQPNLSPTPIQPPTATRPGTPVSSAQPRIAPQPIATLPQVPVVSQAALADTPTLQAPQPIR